jgi:putative ABC transport system permease protein
MRYTYHDAEFFNTYGIELIDGKGFLPDSAGNQRGSVVLNEAAAKAFGFEDSYEKTIQIGDNEIEVVGIIRDFNFETLRAEITPILHFHRIPSNGVHQYITVRINPQQVNESLDFLEDKWSIVSDTDSFEYFFLEDGLKEMYAAEDRLLKMVSSFSLVTIFIACLGLYGLSSFMIEKRKKEMGIRKVLGASARQLFYSTVGKFLLFIGGGFAFAIPLGYYLSNEWLHAFAYKVPVGVDVYAIALIGTLLVGLTTVSYKSMLTASMNPVDTLKEE